MLSLLKKDFAPWNSNRNTLLFVGWNLQEFKTVFSNPSSLMKELDLEGCSVLIKELFLIVTRIIKIMLF
jgi:hypothetical protein